MLVSCGQIRVVYIIMSVRARLLHIHTVGRESGCPSLLLRSHYPELKGSLVGACGGAAGISKESEPEDSGFGQLYFSVSGLYLCWKFVLDAQYYLMT